MIHEKFNLFLTVLHVTETYSKYNMSKAFNVCSFTFKKISHTLEKRNLNICDTPLFQGRIFLVPTFLIFLIFTQLKIIGFEIFLATFRVIFTGPNSIFFLKTK